MPQGVASAFFVLLDDDRRIAARRAGWMLGVGLALFAAAWSLWFPWGLAVHAGALGLGALLGGLLSRLVHRRYETGLTEAWSDWMDAARQSRSVAEVARRVTGRRPTVPRVLWVLLVFVLAAGEAVLLWLAVQEDADTLLAVPVLAWQGLAAGVLWVCPWRAGAWRRTFRHSLDEMVADGELRVEGA